MEIGDFGEECANCQCLICVENDDTICENCNNCKGNIGYDKWMMECKNFNECINPEDTIRFILKK